MYTPEDKMEPEDTLLEEENHLNQTIIFGFKLLIFGGVFVVVILISVFGCFLKWCYPDFTPQKMIIFSRKTHGSVRETHHFITKPQIPTLSNSCTVTHHLRRVACAHRLGVSWSQIEQLKKLEGTQVAVPYQIQSPSGNCWKLCVYLDIHPRKRTNVDPKKGLFG